MDWKDLRENASKTESAHDKTPDPWPTGQFIQHFSVSQINNLGPFQTPLHSCAEPNLIKFDFRATLERRLVQTAYLFRT